MYKHEYNVGDKVIYNGEETVIAALYNDGYIVPFTRGWIGSANDKFLCAGSIDKEKLYNYCCNANIIKIHNKEINYEIY